MPTIAPAPNHSPHSDADVDSASWDGLADSVRRYKEVRDRVDSGLRSQPGGERAWVQGYKPYPTSGRDIAFYFSWGPPTLDEVDEIAVRLRYAWDPSDEVVQRWIEDAETAALRLVGGHGAGRHTAPAPPADVRMPRSSAAPDPELWATAVDIEPRIAGAAERALGMPSPSEHDLSLAHHLGGLGWEPQAIADAIAWIRRRRGEKPKHLAYYRHTIRRALEGHR